MQPSSPFLGRPTGIRYSILALLCALSMITYIDRAFWGSAQEDIRNELGLKTVADLAIALWAFQLAYALFEVPTGYLGDRYGPRKTLIRIVLWWSFFFCLTTLVGYEIRGIALVGVTGLTILVVFRFLFGMGEAGAYPNTARALYNWFPLSQRGTAQGAVWMSARFMGGLTPLIWLCLVHPQMLGLHWKAGFWVFGLVGLTWCAIFALWFRNRPEEHPAVNPAERALITSGRGTEPVHEGVPWGKIFRSRNMWYICGMYVCINYGWYFFMYFLPDFLKRRFGSADDSLGDKAVMALLAGGPLLVGVLGCVIGGILTDRHVRRTGDRKWGRRLYGVIGLAGAAGCYCLAIFGAVNQNMWIFAIGVAMSGFCNDLTMGASWAVCQDIGRRYSAIVSGFMNMIGNLGGVTTIIITAAIMNAQVSKREAEVMAQHTPTVTTSVSPMESTILEASDSVTTGAQLAAARERGLIDGYIINLSLYALAYFIGVLFWLKIDATKPIDPGEPQPTPDPAA
ncbi:MAG: MFS transporter [Planctomycetia bacterium]|nr:MFS transporter [Planctomycetia bacterium]